MEAHTPIVFSFDVCGFKVCIAHSKDKVEAKIDLTLYIQWSCLLKSASNSKCQSFSAKATNISDFTLICSLNHRPTEFCNSYDWQEFSLHSQCDHTSIRHAHYGLKSVLSYCDWSAILSAVGSNIIGSVAINCREQATRQAFHSCELLNSNVADEKARRKRELVSPRAEF